MKKHLLQLSGILSISYSICVGQTPSPTQTVSPTPIPNVTSIPAASNTSDPFVTVKGATASNPPDPDAPMQNIVRTVVEFDVDQDDAANLLQNLRPCSDRYTRILDLERAGKAKLVNLMSCNGGATQHTTISSIQTVLAPDTYDQLAIPTHIKPYYAGDNLSFDCVTIDKGLQAMAGAKLLGTFWLTKGFFVGFHDRILMDTSKKVGMSQLAYCHLAASKLYMPAGEMTLLGTLNSDTEVSTSDKAQVPVRLVFGKLDIVPVSKEPDSLSPQNDTAECQFSFYSMDRESGAEILEKPVKENSVFGAVQDLLKDGRAKLEKFSVVDASFDNYSKIGENPMEHVLDPNGNMSNSIVSGLLVDFLYSKAGSANEIELECKIRRNIGDLQATGMASNYMPQPVIQNRSVQTNFYNRLGETSFIGTFNEPSETGVNGTRDSGRVWFGFVTTLDRTP